MAMGQAVLARKRAVRIERKLGGHQLDDTPAYRSTGARDERSDTRLKENIDDVPLVCPLRRQSGGVRPHQGYKSVNHPRCFKVAVQEGREEHLFKLWNKSQRTFPLQPAQL